MAKWVLPANAINFGLLILRVGIGALFIMHGFPKITGGAQKWLWLGGQMKNLGIAFWPLFWGFAAACAEFFGGFCLTVGLFTRLAAVLMSCVMIVATVYHVSKNDPFTQYSHPLSLLVVFIALAITGAGKYSLDYYFKI